MDETELAHRDLMQRLNSSTVTSSSKLPGLARGAYRGLPPTHPHHISPPSLYSQQISPSLPHHSRSLSQPVFFSQDSTLPYSSPPATFSAAMDHPLVRTEGLPPLKAHRRSHSDIPFGFLARPPAVKQESECSDGAGEDDTVGEDLFTAYMNLDSLDALNSSEDRRDDIDSRASGSKTNGGGDSSENEAESSSVNESRPQKEGNKRGAGGEPVRHCRSLSMDSFMGKLSFAEESPRISTVARTGQESPNVSFGNGEFSAAELKKVMASEKLAEIAMTDPRRVKRILANRQSAARSKERKTRYISELEHKVHTLQTEATTLSAQLTMFQRDYSGLNSQNNELKFRLQAMEQQAKLRDALNDALTGEVQRLKVAAAEMGESQLSNSLNRQIQLNPHMFQLHQLQKQQQQQQQQQYQFQQQQQEQSNSVSNNETNQ